MSLTMAVAMSIVDGDDSGQLQRRRQGARATQARADECARARARARPVRGVEIEGKGGALSMAAVLRRKGRMSEIPDSKILCQDQFCVTTTVRCWP